MRLDKFLCDNAALSRSEAKKAIASSHVLVNGNICKRPDAKIDETIDVIKYDSRIIKYEKYVYFMLNKPAGYVSANVDSQSLTVIDLFKSEGRKNLSCVGRLDKDTTGLLIVTDDGDLIHRLTSPKSDIYKKYLVSVSKPVTLEDKALLESGVDIHDDEITKPAIVNIIDDSTIELSISEGRFHQVKRMLIAVGNEVTALKREAIGDVVLDDNLLPGEYRRLTDKELNLLNN